MIQNNMFFNMAQNVINKNPNFKNNPVIQNAYQMAMNNDINGLKQIADNICKSKGINMSDIESMIPKK